MPSLGETISRLARGRQALAAAVGMVDGGEGRMSEIAHFGANPGGLRALAYAPANLPPDAPLVVVLHGCGQAAEPYAAQGGWLDLADRLGFAVLAPEQLSLNNPNRCFNWFSAADMQRGQGEAASIAQMIGHWVRARRLDPGRVFVTGLSAGGAMSAVMLAAYPELLAGAAVIAGLPYGAARNVQEALKLMRSGDGRDGPALAQLVRAAAPGVTRRPFRLSIWQGGADLVVNPANARDLAGQWTAVAGLNLSPDRVSEAGDLVRSTWSGPGGIVELVTIEALGHGEPLAARGPDGLGEPAPFMLEASVSSVREIARFWGLGEAAAVAPPNSEADPGPSPGRNTFADRAVEALRGHLPAKAHEAVIKALRASGLLR